MLRRGRPSIDPHSSRFHFKTTSSSLKTWTCRGEWWPIHVTKKRAPRRMRAVEALPWEATEGKAGTASGPAG